MDFCHQECLEDGAIWAVKGYLLEKLNPIIWSREIACMMRENQAMDHEHRIHGKVVFAESLRSDPKEKNPAIIKLQRHLMHITILLENPT